MSGCHVPSETIEERIEKLEEKINQLNYSNCKRIEENTLISRRLTQIEIILKVYPGNCDFEKESMPEMIRRIGMLGEALNALSEENNKLKKTPYKCPVCEGKGYWNSIENSIACGGQCKSCEGKGIVWE